MSDIRYEFIGRFIYMSFRYGGDLQDAANWFADHLNAPRVVASDILDITELYDAYYESFPDDEARMQDHEAFQQHMSKTRGLF